jgi:hypothetical protein
MRTKHETTLKVFYVPSSWSYFVTLREVRQMAERSVVACGQNTVSNNVLALLRSFISLNVYYPGNNCKNKRIIKSTCLGQCIF